MSNMKQVLRSRTHKRIILAAVFSLLTGVTAVHAEVFGNRAPPLDNSISAEDIQSRLKTLAELDYSSEAFYERIADGRLATLYSQLKTQRDWARSLLPLVTDKEPPTVAANNLERLITNIQTFHSRYAEQTPLGDKAAYEQPDVIVILGANRSVLEKRLAFALPLIEAFPASTVVLSGGGRTIELEAAVMRDYLIAKGVAAHRLVMESDSLDTVGNAVFTSMTLARKPDSGSKVLLVTSSFHAPRALFLFQNILNKRFQIAVTSVPQDTANPSQRVDSELQQQATSINDLFTWAVTPGRQSLNAPSVSGACSVFYQVLLNHKLYSSRWDLSRKYADLCALSS